MCLKLVYVWNEADTWPHGLQVRHLDPPVTHTVTPPRTYPFPTFLPANPHKLIHLSRHHQWKISRLT